MEAYIPEFAEAWEKVANSLIIKLFYYEVWHYCRFAYVFLPPLPPPASTWSC